MQALIGLLLTLAGVVVGLYCGVWWAFIGGIVDVITEVRAENLSALGVAIGVGKIFFSGFIGWIAFAVLAVPGMAMVQSS